MLIKVAMLNYALLLITTCGGQILMRTYTFHNVVKKPKSNMVNVQLKLEEYSSVMCLFQAVIEASPFDSFNKRFVKCICKMSGTKIWEFGTVPRKKNKIYLNQGRRKQQKNGKQDKKKFGDACKSDPDCSYRKGNCVRGRCSCIKGYRYASKKKECGIKRKKYGNTCRSITECSYANGRCFRGRCSCDIGYSYNYSENECVTKCTKYGSTFSLYPKSSVNGHNTKRKSLLTWSDCMRACKNERDFVCIHAEFGGESFIRVCKMCETPWSDIQDEDKNIGTDPKYKLYYRNCKK